MGAAFGRYAGSACLLYFVDLLGRRKIRMIRNNPIKMVLRGNAQHVRLCAVYAVTKQFRFARVQQQ